MAIQGTARNTTSKAERLLIVFMVPVLLGLIYIIDFVAQRKHLGVCAGVNNKRLQNSILHRWSLCIAIFRGALVTALSRRLVLSKPAGNGFENCFETECHPRS
jgi:hypothetical protein